MYIEHASENYIQTAISHMAIGPDEVVLILLGPEHSSDIQALINGLNADKVNFVGGIFPGLICGKQYYKEGALLLRFPVIGRPCVFTGLSQGTAHIMPEWDFVAGNLGKSRPTALILVDGLAAGIGAFLSDVVNQLGNSVNYLGGGAGSLTLQQEPCLFTAEGFIEDAAVVTFINQESSLGVRHGWESIMGPLIATRTCRNVIIELNWQNAFELYKKVVEGDSGKIVTVKGFFDVAKAYPFGMLKERAENIVRDPIAVNDRGELICIGEVHENAALEILKGCNGSLIKAAVQAVDDCLTTGGNNFGQSFIIDCISRVLFLEDDFQLELAAVNERLKAITGAETMDGILTLGEISSAGDGCLEFFNKTIVVGMFYE